MKHSSPMIIYAGFFQMNMYNNKMADFELFF